MAKMNIQVDVTGTEQFQEVISILHYAYEKAEEPVKEEIHNRLNEVIGKTHYIDEFKGENNV